MPTGIVFSFLFFLFSFLLFICAATAAGLMESEQALWPKIQAAVEGADER